MTIRLVCIAVASLLVFANADAAQSRYLEPYGTASKNMHSYPRINRVYDVNYNKPQELYALYSFITNVNRVVPGKSVVVLHGAEIRAFAKENYLKYQDIIDKMASLAHRGVEFRMCNNAMHAAGFRTRDMDGFITVIPAGFAEIIYLESKGYRYINAVPTPVKDSRCLDNPKAEICRHKT
ncbi:MAG: DsrE family protein [Acidiferrobacterales bacterium]